MSEPALSATSRETDPAPDLIFHATFSTGALDGGERLAAVRSAVLGLVEITPLADPLEATIDSCFLDPLTVIHARGSRQRRTRSAEQIAVDGVDLITVSLSLKGRSGGHADGRSFAAGPGEVGILDWARPFTVQDEGPHEVLTIVSPRAVMGQLVPRPAALHGRVLDVEDAVLLAGFLRALLPTLPETRAAHGGVLARVVLDLLAVTLGGAPVGPAAPEAWPIDEENLEALFDRAVSWIDRHLTAASMSPDDLAAGLGVSRTRLYLAFDGAGGVAQHILKRRLGKVHHAILNPDETRGVQALAMAGGFQSSTHFARVFRAAYGLTPSELRRRVMGTG